MMSSATSQFVAFLVATMASGLQADPSTNVCLKTPVGPFRKYVTEYVKKFVDPGNLQSSLTQSKLKCNEFFSYSSQSLANVVPLSLNSRLLSCSVIMQKTSKQLFIGNQKTGSELMEPPHRSRFVFRPGTTISH